MFARLLNVEKAQAALLEIGRFLQASNYKFITVTPETHRRVLAREAMQPEPATSLRDVFGWNKAFVPTTLPPQLLRLLSEAEAYTEHEGLWRSKVRFSSLGRYLLLHSAFPTTDANAVFFGPDTYRFCHLLERHASAARRLVDIGCGTGAGGLTLAPSCARVVLSDVNPLALAFAQVNAALAGIEVEVIRSDVLAAVKGDVDLVIANPPYLRDEAQRVYRDGGGQYGEGLAVRMVQEALKRLQPKGRLIVYTGSAIVAGVDQFFEAVRPLLAAADVQYEYSELDPDVFGEELSLPAYRDVDRLAAVALCAQVP